MENETKSILFKGSKTSIKFNNNLNGESMARKIPPPPPPPPQKKNAFRVHSYIMHAKTFFAMD